MPETRELLTYCVNKLSNTPYQDFCRQSVADFRDIPKMYLDRLQCFYVEKGTEIKDLLGEELYENEKLGFVKNGQNVFRERFILPCWDVNEMEAGLVGYDNDQDTYKYMLSKTYGFGRKYMVYGLNAYDTILEKDYCILVEGIFDFVRLWSLGYPVIAYQGTYEPSIAKSLFGRLKGVIKIPDNDKAGRNAMLFWAKSHPLETPFYLKEYKDIDEYLRIESNQVKFKAVVEQTLEEWKYLRASKKIIS